MQLKSMQKSPPPPPPTEKAAHRGLTAQWMEKYRPVITLAVLFFNIGRVFAAERRTTRWSDQQGWASL